MATKLPADTPKRKRGRPVGTKGIKHAATITKEQGREALRTIVLGEMQKLVHAQLANAAGLNYLVVRDKSSGKFIRVARTAAEKLDPTKEIIEIWAKDPSVQAFTDLMNRALDKPKEQEQEVSVRGALIVSWDGDGDEGI